jgi:PIN domain nuclease of toxin-antitoxin system
MRLLLDTHVFIWAVDDDPKLSRAARDLMAEATEVYVSSASVWQSGIKAGLGKLNVDVERLLAEIEVGTFLELPVRAVHGAMAQHLPRIHRDPFDRLLIAQALAEPLLLLTSDGHLSKYTDLVIPV